MAVDYFIGWTQVELETELRRSQEELARGKSITQASAGDSSFQFKLEQTIRERISMLLFKLNQLDPDTYPTSSTRPIRRTQVVFPATFGEAPADE
jgi:hypothetical protein